MSKSQLIESQKALAKSFPLIGYIVWWSINNAVVSRERLKEIFQTVGLPVEWLPEEIDPRSAFFRAVQKCKTGEGKNYVIKQIDDREDEIVFGVVKATADKAAEELLFDPENKLRFSKVTQTITIQNKEAYPNSRFESYYDTFSNNYDSHEIRKMLLDIVNDHLSGVNVREKGGVYYIVDGDAVKKLAQAVSLINDESGFDYLPIVDTQQTRNTMLKTFLSEIHKEMEGFRDECKLYLGKDDTRPSTLKNKLEAFQKLRAKISVYEDALEYAASDLKTEIGAMTENIKKYLLSHDLSV